MKCNILTEERWHRLLADELAPEESQEIIEHLDTDCPDCREFLMSMDQKTELNLSEIHDELVDDLQKNMTVDANGTLTAVKPHEYSTNPGLQVKQWLGSIWNFPQALASSMSGAVALLLLSLVVLPQLYVNGDSYQKLEGISPVTDPIDISFTTGHHQEEGPIVVQRGLSGKSYDNNELIFLHYKIKTQGYVYLIGYQEGLHAELLFPFENRKIKRQHPGNYNVVDNGEIIGFPIDNLRGRYIVVGIHSPRPLDIQRQVIPFIEKSANFSDGSINTKKTASLGNNIALDTVYFDISS